MNNGPDIALIISTYNQPEYLARLLAAVSRQTCTPAELLLADDGSTEDTRNVFTRWAAEQPFHTRHLWQQHEGFRKSRILNDCIAAARSAYVVFLDGDTLPHPHFIADHRQMAWTGFFAQGHRALVEQRAAAWFGLGHPRADRWRALFAGQLRGVANAFRWPLGWRRIRGGLRGIRGCNFGVWRTDLLNVNGFNEEFEGWGREDAELALRLMNSGVRRFNARGRAVCYHLWHPPAPRGSLSQNDVMLAHAIAEGRRRCALGLDRHLSQPA